MSKKERKYVVKKAKEIVNNLASEGIIFYLMDWILDECKEEIKLLIPSSGKRSIIANLP